MMKPDSILNDFRDYFVTEEARSSFHSNCMREAGYNPEDQASVDQYWQNQENEWIDRGVPDPNVPYQLGGNVSRVENFDNQAHLVNTFSSALDK